MGSYHRNGIHELGQLNKFLSDNFGIYTNAFHCIISENIISFKMAVDMQLVNGRYWDKQQV